MNFFETLNYSSVNEDWRTEALALRVRPTDHALCVTGSGSRPLELLALDAAHVVAIDRNPAQNHLLALHVAAIRRLPFDEYKAFIGLDTACADDRERVLQRLELADASRHFWRTHVHDVRRGVLYAGRWERFYGTVAQLVRRCRPIVLPRLLSCGTLDEQRDLIRREWDTRWWRGLHGLACSQTVLRTCLGDPAFSGAGDGSVANYLFDRMRRALDRSLVVENFMLSLLLTGRLAARDLPPHLTPEGFATIRARLDRLEIITGDVLDHLAPLSRTDRPPRRRYDALSLSDVPSFLDARGFERLLRGVADAATTGARFAIRLFLIRHQFPARMAYRLRRDRDLEQRLAMEDHAFAYDFIAGVVG